MRLLIHSRRGFAMRSVLTVASLRRMFTVICVLTVAGITRDHVFRHRVRTMMVRIPADGTNPGQKTEVVVHEHENENSRQQWERARSDFFADNGFGLVEQKLDDQLDEILAAIWNQLRRLHSPSDKPNNDRTHDNGHDDRVGHRSENGLSRQRNGTQQW